MANVKEVGMCPRCSIELPKAATTKCEACGYQFPYQTEVFGTPDYISSQYDVLQSQVETVKKDKDNAQWLLERARMKFYVNMADEDRVLALRDAEDILRHLFVSNSRGEKTKEVLSLGKRVGELAKVIDEHIRLGGRPDGFSDTAQPRTGRTDPFEPGGEGDSATAR